MWNRTGTDRDIGVIDYPVISDIEDYDYKLPDVDEAKLRGELE